MDETIDLPLRSTILVVEDDKGTRSILAKHLPQLGYRLLVAANFEAAIKWISGNVYIHADLANRQIARRGITHRGTLAGPGSIPLPWPLVVMPERVGKDVEGTDEKVGANDWIVITKTHFSFNDCSDVVLR